MVAKNTIIASAIGTVIALFVLGMIGVVSSTGFDISKLRR